MTADPDFQPIIFTEDYRRAKRNSLWWSGIALAATIGVVVPGSESDASSGPVIIELFQTGLGYHQWQLVLVTGVIAIFMWLGFLRSERIIKRRNSRWAFEQKFTEIDELLNAIPPELEMAFQQAGRARGAAQEFEGLVAENIEYIENAASSSKDHFSELKRAIPNLIKRFDGQTTSSESIVTDNQAVAEQIANEIDKANAFVDELASDLVRRCNYWLAGYNKNLDNVDDHARQSLEIVKSLSKRLSGWHEGILLADRSWHFWHDRVPVWGLFFTAAGSSAMYFFLLLF